MLCFLLNPVYNSIILNFKRRENVYLVIANIVELLIYHIN